MERTPTCESGWGFFVSTHRHFCTLLKRCTWWQLRQDARRAIASPSRYYPTTPLPPSAWRPLSGPRRASTMRAPPRSLLPGLAPGQTTLATCLVASMQRIWLHRATTRRPPPNLASRRCAPSKPSPLAPLVSTLRVGLHPLRPRDAQRRAVAALWCAPSERSPPSRRLETGKQRQSLAFSSLKGRVDSRER